MVDNDHLYHQDQHYPHNHHHSHSLRPPPQPYHHQPPPPREYPYAAYGGTNGTTSHAAARYQDHARPQYFDDDDSFGEHRYQQQQQHSYSHDVKPSYHDNFQHRHAPPSASYNDSYDDTRFNNNNNYYQKNNNYMTESSTTKPPPPAETTIEIAPGVSRALRGAAETNEAIMAGYCVKVSCMICETNMRCVADCEMVLCPNCMVVSPNTHEYGPFGALDTKRGVGLGLVVES
jgi:hypothetical protein